MYEIFNKFCQIKQSICFLEYIYIYISVRRIYNNTKIFTIVDIITYFIILFNIIHL